MKKNFPLTHPRKHPDRVLEGIKFEINKYLKRERSKSLSDGVDFWDFACKFGLAQEAAVKVHLAELSKSLETAKEEGATSCYIEIIAKPGYRRKRARSDESRAN